MCAGIDTLFGVPGASFESAGLFLVFHSPEKCACPERFGRIFWIAAALLVEIPFPCSLPIGAKKEPNVTASAMRRFFLVRGGGMRRSGTTMLDAERGINDGREAVGPVMAALVKQRTRAPSRRTIRR